MTLPCTVAEVLREHGTLQVECIDRMYLNVYIPQLQCDKGVANFLRFHRGHKLASTALMSPMTVSFGERIENFVKWEGLERLLFNKGERKDDVAARYRTAFKGTEGVPFVGKAQEKAWVFRSERRKHPETGTSYAWIVRTTAAARKARFRYDLSIVQAEFSLTQVLDRPVMGVFFEEAIRENLDLGRPSHLQLIFEHRVTRRTSGRFRTRVVTEGVTPSLHVDYKRSHIKQYHKEGKALRTETTVNDPRDFKIGKRLKNLPALREIGFAANRRLLEVQRVSQDCALEEDALRRVEQPIVIEGQRTAALRFSDPCVQALMHILLRFLLLPRGFSNGDLREYLAPMLDIDPSLMTLGRMSYDLRRLCLHGIVRNLIT